MVKSEGKVKLSSSFELEVETSTQLSGGGGGVLEKKKTEEMGSRGLKEDPYQVCGIWLRGVICAGRVEGWGGGEGENQMRLRVPPRYRLCTVFQENP